MFLFILTLLNASYSSFITCAYFTTTGSADDQTDKIIIAIIQVYKLLNIDIKFLILDGDTHCTKNYVMPLYLWIKYNFN